MCHVSTQQFLLMWNRLQEIDTVAEVRFAALVRRCFCLKGLITCAETQIGNLSWLSGNTQ